MGWPRSDRTLAAIPSSRVLGRWTGPAPVFTARLTLGRPEASSIANISTLAVAGAAAVERELEQHVAGHLVAIGDLEASIDAQVSNRGRPDLLDRVAEDTTVLDQRQRPRVGPVGGCGRRQRKVRIVVTCARSLGRLCEHGQRDDSNDGDRRDPGCPPASRRGSSSNVGLSVSTKAHGGTLRSAGELIKIPAFSWGTRERFAEDHSWWSSVRPRARAPQYFLFSDSSRRACPTRPSSSPASQPASGGHPNVT